MYIIRTIEVCVECIIDGTTFVQQLEIENNNVKKALYDFAESLGRYYKIIKWWVYYDEDILD